jgi:hypothetical protein
VKEKLGEFGEDAEVREEFIVGCGLPRSRFDCDVNKKRGWLAKKEGATKLRSASEGRSDQRELQTPNDRNSISRNGGDASTNGRLDA